MKDIIGPIILFGVIGYFFPITLFLTVPIFAVVIIALIGQWVMSTPDRPAKRLS